MRRVLAVALLVLTSGVIRCRAGELLWYAEGGAGEPVATSHAGEPLNPASVVKVGTSWFALERLGVQYRYVTRFGFTGSLDRRSGSIVGDLVVGGGGDPDFQPENAFLVARKLNRLGIRRVEGDLVIDGAFWLGWEGGPFRRAADPAHRARLAGKRLARAMESERWGAAERQAWEKLCARRGWPVREAPSVCVEGRVRVGPAVQVHPLVVHRSNPLPVILKRFNVFSNNDIERIADGLGGSGAVETFLRERVATGIRLETACGLGTNRMSCTQVVRMIRGFHEWLDGHGLSLRDLLPVPGCDPGPIPKMFPVLAKEPLARAVVCKSGTLSETDGGVAVLAGSFRPPGGRDIYFCVAAPRAGGALARLRDREQAWLVRLIERAGGTRSTGCGAPLLFSDARAGVEDQRGRRDR